MNKEQAQIAFSKYDTESTGYISRGELSQLIQEHNLSLSVEDIEAYIQAVDTDNDSKISFEEFNHLAQFERSQLGQYKSLLNFTSASLGIAKQVEKLVDVEVLESNKRSDAKIVLKDKEGGETDKTTIELAIGDFDANETINSTLGDKINADAVIGIKFAVKNVDKIKSAFEEYVQALKDFLGELGPEAEQLLASLDIKLTAVSDGVLLTIDPSAHGFIASYIDALRKNFEKLQHLNSAVSIKVSSGSDIASKSTTLREALSAPIKIELSGKALRLSRLILAPQVKAYLMYLNSDKDSKGNLLVALCALSVQTADLEFLLSSSGRKDFVNNSELAGLDSSILEKHINYASTMLTESGLGEFIDSLDFIKAAINDLKDAECTGVTVFAKVHEVYALATVSADGYDVLDELFGLKQ